MVRYEPVIHEYDPYFNYRATSYLVRHGAYEFFNWFDHRSWYPLGRIVGQTASAPPAHTLSPTPLHWRRA